MVEFWRAYYSATIWQACCYVGYTDSYDGRKCCNADILVDANVVCSYGSYAWDWDYAE
ncbi:MAG: hypothetical protein J6U64_00815 [Alphaproteobacteria bacterium]|nr:hypothetical protein [Alphaproteobacteria bacterium]